jgi:cytochrome P450
MLRYDGPLETPTYRFTVDPSEIAGTLIPGGGQLVLIALGNANRDPNHYPEPDDFDITRETKGHLAFGHGIHYCLGAPLARLEGRIAVTTLLTRCPELTLGTDPETLIWRRGIMVRGPRTLPVRLQ